MAREANFTEDDEIFVGEDKFFYFEVWDDDQDPPVLLDASTMTDIVWFLRKNDTTTSVLLSKSLGSGIDVIGVFNADPVVNTQRVRLILLDTDTWPDDGKPIKPGSYRHSLKRRGDGIDTILSFGDFVLREATARA